MARPSDASVSLSRSVARALREEVDLRDGRRVELRPIRPRDANLLVDFHEMLSPETRYLRFFSPQPRLSRKVAEYSAASSTSPGPAGCSA